MAHHADMDFFFQCAALTSPLVQRGQLKLAANSWVLVDSSTSQDWNSNTDSMAKYYESDIHSAVAYGNLVGDAVQQHMAAELECNLTVKWMMACGGSWAWEAANMVSCITKGSGCNGMTAHLLALTA